MWWNMLIFETRLSICSTWKNGFFFSYPVLKYSVNIIHRIEKKVENSLKSLLWNQWISFHFLITSNVIAFFCMHFKSAYRREKKYWFYDVNGSHHYRHQIRIQFWALKRYSVKCRQPTRKYHFPSFSYFSLCSRSFFIFLLPKRKGDMIRSIIYFRYFSSMNGILSCWNKKMTKI